MNKVIVTADLGHFRAYRVSEDPLNMASPKLDLIESYDSLEAHEKLSDKVSDSAGRFKRAGLGEAMAGYSERNRIGLEEDRRLVRMIAEKINEIIVKEGPEAWHLATAEKINNSVLKGLAPEVRARLAKNLKANLTNTKKCDLLGYFA
jgi:Fe-S cluster biosynthesis and repair protein YggX